MPNVINRDFHADKPNEKWLTDITEFHIPAGKVCLSPMIDCFDGLPISWTIGTSPDAELVNTMLDAAIQTLNEDEHPIVHSDRGWGGADKNLQEMVVLLIEYHFLRNDSKEYQRNKSKYDTKPVEIAILSASRKISNMIFSLSFFRKEPVSTNREKAMYQLYFTDANGASVSDIVKLIADKTSENEQERIYRCSFNLKSRKYSAVDDFDFFS